MKRLFAAILAVIGFPFLVSAQEEVIVDTLATANPAKVLVVNPDFTWKCVTVPGFTSFVSESDWDNFKPVPYDFSMDFVPEKTYFCLADEQSGFCMPCDGKVAVKYGNRRSRKHMGVDLEAPVGTDVKAAFDGKVRIASDVAGYGRLVVIRHENGLETFYGFLAAVAVPVDAMVKAGDVIGSMGNMGETSECRIHFEVRYQGYSIDPSYFINFNKGKLVHDVAVVRKSTLSEDMRYVPQSDSEELAIAKADAAAKAEAARKEAERLASQWHTVKAGDTLSKLAVKYNTTVQAICRMNNIKSTSVLTIGKKLKVK